MKKFSTSPNQISLFNDNTPVIKTSSNQDIIKISITQNKVSYKDILDEMVQHYVAELESYGFNFYPITETIIGSSINRFGRCIRKVSPKRHCSIEISEFLFKEGKHAVKNTLLHELCHAMVSSDDGHGPHWKKNAKKVSDIYGITIQRLATVEESAILSKHVAFKYTVRCNKCGKILSQTNRKTKLVKFLLSDCHEGIAHFGSKKGKKVLLSADEQQYFVCPCGSTDVQVE